jgi:hypothetical protein
VKADPPAIAPAPTPAAPPPVPVAASPAEAVAAALRGEAVKVPLGGREPAGLALRELIPRDGVRAFEAGFAGRRFEVVVPADADPADVVGRVLPMMAEVPSEMAAKIRRLTVRRPAAETFAYVAEVADAAEKTVTVEVTRMPRDAKAVAYEVADAHGRFELVTPPDARDPWEVAQAFHLWAMIPPALRGALETITVDEGANPTDAEFGRQYDKPDFVSAASAANGAATFWHGTKYLQEDVFLHEFGHVLGQTLSTKNELFPDDWPAAIAADARSVSSYGDTNATEDFAEAFWVYMTLRRGGRPTNDGLPATLDAFASAYPRRAAILEAVFRGDLRPATP